MTERDFDWALPLPTSPTTMVLEASAGTGKTYTICGMAARFVCEGVPLDRLLAVTFSRRATAELRDGVRDRLVRSRDTLRRVLGGGQLGDDEVDRVIASGEPAVLASRLERIETAIGQVDAAPIVTLHTFAKRMLDELGLLADHDQTVELGSDLDVLADEVIADVYLSDEQWQEIDWEYARQLGRQATAHASEQLYPSGEESRLRVGFAAAVRAEFDRRKRLRQVLDYDDMIFRLAQTLTDPATGAAAAEVLSGRFGVVLVDEFQDTDPQQWAFLKAGFHRRSIMMLIGDPKQAIYRFRGGDIETYTAARESADQVLRLGTNYRSDSGVVRGVESVFRPIDFGTAGAPIMLRRITARHTDRGSGVTAAIQARRCGSGPSTRRRWVSRPATGAADLLAQVNLLLDGHQEVRNERGEWHRSARRHRRPGEPEPGRPAGAPDAVGQWPLLGVQRRGQRLHHRAARDWLVLLEALDTPDRWHLRRAMMTSLVGWTSADIAAASGDELVSMTALLTTCARLLTEQGVASVFETLASARQLYARLLSRPDGEALVSDLRHVAELLNQTAHLSASALTGHLRRRIERAAQEQDERTRRLATDRQAIRVLTVHQAKGLQFPIVLLPQAADTYFPDADDDVPIIGHQDGVRVLDVAPPRERARRTENYRAEEAAESLRAFYVACTRAQSLLVMWWAPAGNNTCDSPLHRLLLNTDWGGPPPARQPLVPADQLPGRPHVDLTLVDLGQLAQPSTTIDAEPEEPRQLLAARTFRDHIDRAWSRTSYTGLTAAVHGTGGTSGFEAESDETELPTDGPDAAPAPGQEEEAASADSPVSALAALPGGTQFGSLVHAVLERVDPADAELPGTLRRAVDDLVDRFPLSGLDTEALTEGLTQTLATPLGRLTDDQSLRELGARNRLAELDFELPLGGDRRRRVADLAALFDRLPPSDPLHDYGRQLADSAAAETVLAGFLTGSIDVVLQVPGPEPRFVVLDYKTNRVPTAADQPLTAHHYTPAAMTAAMCAAHYPLQALLYCAALHRYLAWRLPAYHPERHLGGVGYLFVRGMTGADNPTLGTMPAGVFTWSPPATMVVRASELLAGGE